MRDVVEGHDPRDDLAVRAVHRRCGHLDVAPLAGVGPRHKELGLRGLSPHRSIQRVRTWRDGAAGYQVFDVDGIAELGERLELRDTEDFPRSRIGLVPAVRPTDEDPIAERIEEMPMEVLLSKGLGVQT